MIDIQIKRIGWILGVVGALGAVAMAPAGCKDDDDAQGTNVDAGDTDAGDAGEASEFGTVKGTIKYEGSLTGPNLYVALFPENAGPETPPDFAKGLDVKFPATYEFLEVPPGKYLSLAFLSVGSDHQEPSLTTDPASMPTLIEVKAGETTTADITLMDPDPDAGM